MDFDAILLGENEIWSDQAEKDKFLKTKVKLNNTFWITFLGMCALRKNHPTDVKIKTYFTSQRTLRLSNVTDDDNDIIVSLNELVKRGSISQVDGDNITKILAKLKTGAEIHEGILFKSIKKMMTGKTFTKTLPTKEIYTLIEDFKKSKITLNDLIVPFYNFAKSKKLAKEYTKIAKHIVDGNVTIAVATTNVIVTAQAYTLKNTIKNTKSAVDKKIVKDTIKKKETFADKDLVVAKNLLKDNKLTLFYGIALIMDSIIENPTDPLSKYSIDEKKQIFLCLNGTNEKENLRYFRKLIGLSRYKTFIVDDDSNIILKVGRHLNVSYDGFKVALVNHFELLTRDADFIYRKNSTDLVIAEMFADNPNNSYDLNYYIMSLTRKYVEKSSKELNQCIIKRLTGDSKIWKTIKSKPTYVAILNKAFNYNLDYFLSMEPNQVDKEIYIDNFGTYIKPKARELGKVNSDQLIKLGILKREDLILNIDNSVIDYINDKMPLNDLMKLYVEKYPNAKMLLEGPRYDQLFDAYEGLFIKNCTDALTIIRVMNDFTDKYSYYAKILYNNYDFDKNTIHDRYFENKFITYKTYDEFKNDLFFPKLKMTQDKINLMVKVLLTDEYGFKTVFTRLSNATSVISASEKKIYGEILLEYVKKFDYKNRSFYASTILYDLLINLIMDFGINDEKILTEVINSFDGEINILGYDKLGLIYGNFGENIFKILIQKYKLKTQTTAINDYTRLSDDIYDRENNKFNKAIPNNIIQYLINEFYTEEIKKIGNRNTFNSLFLINKEYKSKYISDYIDKFMKIVRFDDEPDKILMRISIDIFHDYGDFFSKTDKEFINVYAIPEVKELRSKHFKNLFDDYIVSPQDDIDNPENVKLINTLGYSGCKTKETLDYALKMIAKRIDGLPKRAKFTRDMKFFESTNDTFLKDMEKELGLDYIFSTLGEKSSQQFFKAFGKSGANVVVIDKLLDKKRNFGIIPEKAVTTEKEAVEILKFNNFDVSKSITPKKKKNQTYKEALELHRRDVKNQLVDIPDLKIKQVQRSKQEMQDFSIKRFDKYHAGKHGDVTLRFIEEFDVSLPTDKWDEFSANFIGTKWDETVMPAFHGTGSVAASMILRFGFKVAPTNKMSNLGIGTAGRMLGDGIYFGVTLDKVAGYVGDGSWAKRYGTIGYVFEMEATLGEMSKDFSAAGLGRDRIRSPEYCVFRPADQLRIYKVFKVEVISTSAIEKMKNGTFYEENGSKFDNTMNKLVEQKIRKPKDKIRWVFYDGDIIIPNKRNEIKFESSVKIRSNDVEILPNQYGVAIEMTNNIGLNGTISIPNVYEFINKDPEGLFSQYKSLMNGKIS